MSRSGTELPTKDEPAGNQRFAKQPAKLFGPLSPKATRRKENVPLWLGDSAQLRHY